MHWMRPPNAAFEYKGCQSWAFAPSRPRRRKASTRNPCIHTEALRGTRDDEQRLVPS